MEVWLYGVRSAVRREPILGDSISPRSAIGSWEPLPAEPAHVPEAGMFFRSGPARPSSRTKSDRENWRGLLSSDHEMIPQIDETKMRWPNLLLPCDAGRPLGDDGRISPCAIGSSVGPKPYDSLGSPFFTRGLRSLSVISDTGAQGSPLFEERLLGFSGTDTGKQ